MSPKGRIFLAFGILALFGVGVSVVIIAIGGGFYAPLSSFLHPPTQADLWSVGENIHPGTILKYSLTRIGSHNSPWSSLGGHTSLINAIVRMYFVRSEGNAWSVMLNVNNGTTTKSITVLLSKQQLTNAGPINKDFIS
ncbi:MAG TPA: hypothetical protein VEP90_19500, partial [Methylomirabilota bacterium]|nr:hypothetical protein [Methylomirabilota bacterium]